MSRFLPCADLTTFLSKRLAIEQVVSIPSDQTKTIRLAQPYMNGSNQYLLEINDGYWTQAQTVLTEGEISSVVLSPTGYTLQAIDPDEVVRTVTRLLVCDGDSITYGGTAGLHYYRYPDQLGRLLGATIATWKIINLGVSGQTLAQMNSDAATQVDPLLNQGDALGKKVLLAWGGINDLGYSGVSTAQTNWTNYMSARASAGWTILAFTTSFVSPSHASITSQMVTDFNAYVRSNYQTYTPYLADIASIPAFSSASVVDGSPFYADQVHPNASGYTLIANYLLTIVQTILSAS